MCVSVRQQDSIARAAVSDVASVALFVVVVVDIGIRPANLPDG